MQMIQAGGVPALTDSLRTADEDNPRGYLEFERVKQLKTDKAWLDGAQGMVVKIIHLLLMELPCDREYRVIFMRRDLNEVVRSQAKMLERSGRKGAAMPPEKLIEIFRAQVRTVIEWLASKPNFKTLEVDYAAVLSDPAREVNTVNSFLGGVLDESPMLRCVDPTLYRNKT